MLFSSIFYYEDVTKPKQEPEKNPLKRPSEAKDAKEVAKKLIKTGAIRFTMLFLLSVSFLT